MMRMMAIRSVDCLSFLSLQIVMSVLRTPVSATLDSALTLWGAIVATAPRDIRPP